MQRFYTLFVSLILLVSLLNTAAAQDVHMPDTVLASAVREALDLEPDAPITQQAMLGLTRLEYSGAYEEIEESPKRTMHDALDLAPDAPLTSEAMLGLTHREDNGSDRKIADLTGLEYAINLTELDLWDNQVSDLTPLGNLTNLTGLYLTYNQISDITPLTNLTNLTGLRLDNNQISDITALTNLTNLTELDLWDNQISDITALTNLTNLTRLGLSGNQISDITALTNLTNLTELWLGGNQISDITALTNLTNLTGLGLSGNQISDITALTNLTNLTGLGLWDNQVSDLTPLGNLTNLTGLYLSGNQISDITALTNLTNLTGLYLNGNQISDITALTNLTNLTGLRLDNNQISDITALTNLTNLTELGLSGNQISDITALTNLTNLTRLWLDNNQITDVSPLVGLVNLELLQLAGNPFSDTSPLAELLAQNPELDLDIDPALPRPEKITGPWLWMIAPTEAGQGGANSTDVDSLAAASRGTVTETAVATNGAAEGDAVGGLVWTLGEITAIGENNINDLVNRIGFAQGDVNHHSAYALITLESATVQSGVTMRVGSDDSIKVWLNGEVVHKNAIDRGAIDYQDIFAVNLIAGDNLLLVKVSELGNVWSMFVGIDAEVTAIYKPPTRIEAPPLDVNGDGQVNVIDLAIVALFYGTQLPAGLNIPADVNADGTVNIDDLIAVAEAIDAAGTGGALATVDVDAVLEAVAEQVNAIEGIPEAPARFSTPQRARFSGVAYQNVAAAFEAAKHLATDNARLGKWMPMLKELLHRLAEMAEIPETTALLPNYPNPFNPETWIPYQLAEPAEVMLTIYDVNGRVIRTLALGHQPAGIYTNRGRAAYWDGRNAIGEPVASGVYFYTLTAGDFTATRKMLIRK